MSIRVIVFSTCSSNGLAPFAPSELRPKRFPGKPALPPTSEPRGHLSLGPPLALFDYMGAKDYERYSFSLRSSHAVMQ